ncbi:hypothetical protein [Ktedonospora formicarum]|uniref:hypothetical protein n=1 Tax=Ktedonospora formicarum TaxID=2778364 RepID=UPI001C68DE11|nr:hypothetical protein [Ktedonospora formicarum]
METEGAKWVHQREKFIEGKEAHCRDKTLLPAIFNAGSLYFSLREGGSEDNSQLSVSCLRKKSAQIPFGNELL